jgi:hypothetical protein
MMINESQVVPPPHANEHNISPWLDEQIWGHRLWDQSQWLLFLELLSVAEACHREGCLLDEKGSYYPLLFKPYKRMHLRNILFNNDESFRLAEQHPDSEAAWEAWLKWMAEKAQGIYTRDFSYLKNRFHSFQKFAALVGILRRSDVESGGNKRWTSRFVFPFGANALYEDLIVSATGTASRDYINFGRTGELLYLMLCRCSSAEELKPYLSSIFESQNPWNELLRLMQPGQLDDLSTRGRSYLPYKSHATFDRLGEDLLRIFKLRLPGFDSFPHLVRLGALHIILYQLNIALEWSDHPRRLHFICEVVAPKKTLVRELSAGDYLRNSLLPAEAVEAYINAVEQSNEWQSALTQHGAFLKCRQILEEQVRWGGDADDYSGASEPNQLIAALRETALRSHRHHTANIHRSYGRDIGLVSKRGTNKLRYAPTDSLLKTLLLTNVEWRMELSEFLELLFERYGFVFGDREAERVLAHDEFDKKAFQANAQRLEQRLGSLGTLRRLSDGCAYVENPHGRT